MTRKEAIDVLIYFDTFRERFLRVVSVLAEDLETAFPNQNVASNFNDSLTTKYDYGINKTREAVREFREFPPGDDDVEMLAADL